MVNNLQSGPSKNPQEIQKEYDDLRGKTNKTPGDYEKLVELKQQLSLMWQKSVDDLKKELKQAEDDEDREKASEVQKKIDALQKNSANPQERFDEIFSSTEADEEKKKKLYDFFLAEIQKHKDDNLEIQKEVTNKQSEIERLNAELKKEDVLLTEIQKHKDDNLEIQKEVTDKQTEIARLNAELKKEQDTNNELLTDTPSLKEYFSFERRRLSTMLKKFDKFKKQSDKYPKNLLIYAMWITNTKIFGTRQKLQRGRVTLAWKRKEDDIVKNLKTMLDKLESDSWEKSKWKEAIKVALHKEIDIALKAHIEKLTTKNSLPPRK